MLTVPATRPGAGPMRLARAGVLTAVTVGLSAVAHHAAGGTLPGLLVTALLAELVWAVSFACARWRLSLPVLAGLLGAGQMLLHAAFTALSAPVAAVSVSPHGHGRSASMMLSSPAAEAGPAVMGPMPVAMLLAHVVATLALVIVLSVGEQAVWRLWCWLTPNTLHLPPPPAPQTFRPAPIGIARPRPAAVLRLLAADPRRGPPAPAAG